MDKYKDPPEWSKKSKEDYRKEIERIQTRTWSAAVWQQIAHELVWAIGLLEENPTSPKAWKKVFNVLKVYEQAVRNDK